MKTLTRKAAADMLGIDVERIPEPTAEQAVWIAQNPNRCWLLHVASMQYYANDKWTTVICCDYVGKHSQYAPYSKRAYRIVENE